MITVLRDSLDAEEELNVTKWQVEIQSYTLVFWKVPEGARRLLTCSLVTLTECDLYAHYTYWGLVKHRRKQE